MTKSPTARRVNVSDYVIIGVLVAMIAAFSLASGSFLSLANASILLNQLPALILVTVGMTLVMLVGGIDLSVGSLVALSAGVLGIAVTSWGIPLPLAMALGLLVCAIAGLLSGALVSFGRLPSFIVTLGMLEAARGLAYAVSGSQTIYIGQSIEGLALPISWLGVSPAFLIAVAIAAIAWLILKKTIAGRHLIAIGTNEGAARASGIETRPYRLAVFAVSGTLAGLAGIFNAAYLAAADPNAGSGLELSAIAAAVIGGTSLNGGRGSIPGGLMGVLLIAILQGGLAQVGVSEPYKRVITGLVIILAVLLDSWRSRRI
ncbi:MAG: ABC transporter permease [Sphingobium sp.]